MTIVGLLILLVVAVIVLNLLAVILVVECYAVNYKLQLIVELLALLGGGEATGLFDRRAPRP